MPLVQVWVEVSVDENTVSQLARCELQGESNQIAEPSLGHRVLVWKEAVVGIKSNLMPPLHCSGQEQASQFTSGDRRQRAVEENPNVAALSGTRAFQCGRHIQFLTNLQESQSVILPGLLVEICREKPAGLVRQERIHADGLIAQEMVLDDGVGHREELACLLGDLLSILRAASADGLPVLHVCGHISVPAILVFPSACVDIFSPAK
jgi:hypothetical protein